MTEKDKLTLRKPLTPKGDDAECKAAYEELLKEYAELKDWKVEGIDYISSKAHAVSLEQYNARIGEYAARRDQYNEKFAGRIETIEDVRANIKKMGERYEALSRESENIQKWFDEKWGNEEPSPFPEDESLMERDIEEWKRQSAICDRRHKEFWDDQMKVSDASSAPLKLWTEQYEEECKFEEIQKATDEAFEYVAKHMLADGSGRMLTDEELAERENRRREIDPANEETNVGVLRNR